MMRGSPACGRIRILLGAFVLGGLRGREESLVRAHVAGCASCRAEYQELTEVRTLLDLVAGEAAGTGQLPDQAGPVSAQGEQQHAQAPSPGDSGAKP